jgi:uncharacterized repeat protein (TIGR03803 family)
MHLVFGLLCAALLAACGGGTSGPPSLPSGSPISANDAFSFARQSRTAGTERVVYRFKGGGVGYRTKDGIGPFASLIDVNGTLYGTTKGGGADGQGIVFAVSTTGKERVVHSFKGGYSDGSTPAASLIDVNGTLYGTTSGGSYGTCTEGQCGTVFSVSTTGKERMLYGFKGDYNGGKDGVDPVAGLTNVNGTLYGTTFHGGAHGYSYSGFGTVFSVSTTGKERVVYSFKGGLDGAFPYAGLIDVNGTLYGITMGQGDKNCSYTYGGCGTVFSVSTTGTERVLHRFKGGSDGGNSLFGIGGSLINLNGTLYGTTAFGGDGECQNFIPGCGTVFRISTSGAEKVLYSFKGGSDGAEPGAGLIAVKNTLYGTAAFGGGGSCASNYQSGCGTVFKVNASGKESTLYSFKGGSDGRTPFASLIDVKGTLYGTTSTGGSGCSRYTYGCGTVFAITP